jgi:hypothetical protein
MAGPVLAVGNGIRCLYVTDVGVTAGIQASPQRANRYAAPQGRTRSAQWLDVAGQGYGAVVRHSGGGCRVRPHLAPWPGATPFLIKRHDLGRLPLRPVSCCRLDGSGSNLVILYLMEGTHPGAEQFDAGSALHSAFEHF